MPPFPPQPVARPSGETTAPRSAAPVTATTQRGAKPRGAACASPAGVASSAQTTSPNAWPTQPSAVRTTPARSGTERTPASVQKGLSMETMRRPTHVKVCQFDRTRITRIFCIM